MCNPSSACCLEVYGTAVLEYFPQQTEVGQRMFLAEMINNMHPYPLIGILADGNVLDSSELHSLAKLEGKVNVVVINRYLLTLIERKSDVQRQLFVNLLMKNQPEFAGLSTSKC